MPPHLHYVEPYFGGGSVLLAKNPEGVSEVANDIYGSLTNFWCCLCDPTCFKEMQKKLSVIPFSENTWESAKLYLEQGPSSPLNNAIAFFIMCRQSMAGRMKSFAPLTKNRVRRGMNEQVSAWLGAIEGLPEVHKRLQRVVILNKKALDVIKSEDSSNTLYYLDPTYLLETRTSKDVYAFEMSDTDHIELLDILKQIKGKFLLSGYHSTLYDTNARLNNWNLKEFDLPNNSASGPKKKRMKECVWSNF